ncbi:MAG: DUF3301 domain-containing protein [Chiayiivirga sp.]|uniref:DUF3301 domain-containing protein n=1 Tax=Chiayiivirga sp. TaxID=2041042 RepID=UPI0025BCCF3E|nr:DUF3301 domain-containing protein [Chiayiivirga sp.]MCI1709286.1 DUF3301 domain-containing protein [Chiayiivirga sp.]MCI1730684.1 DUF3301 domain-containing protein [Chiayiivirga sp.]
MLTPVLLLAGFGLIALLWSESRAAAELATHYGRQACARAGVQWLDQSVALSKIALRRAHDGRMRVFRQYRFEYSWQGEDRHQGSLALLGRELQWISAPQRDEPAAPL